MPLWVIALLVLTAPTPTRPAPVLVTQRWAVSGVPGGDVTSLALVPQTPEHVFAGTARGSIYRSDDAGQSWSLKVRLNGPVGGFPVVTDIRIDPTLPSTLYALVGTDVIPSQVGAVTPGTLYRSMDGGDSWESLPESSAIAVDPAHAGTIYRGVPIGPVLKSVDSGQTWIEGSPALDLVKSLVVDSSQPEVVYCVSGSALYRSVDSGAHWARTGPTVPLDFRLQIAGRDGPDSLLGISGGKFYRSADGGGTFENSPIGSVSVTFQVVGEQAAGGPLVAATDRGVFRSDDIGLTWVGGDSFYGYPVRTVGISESDVLYAGTFRGGGGFQGGAGLFRSEDGGTHWSSSNQGLSETAVVVAATDVRNPARLYAGGPGVFRSEDHGTTWLKTQSELRVQLLAVDPSRSDHVYAVSDGIVWQSIDAGFNFARANGPPGTISTLVADADGVLYAGGSQGVFRSTDTGRSWTPAGAGLPTPTLGVAMLVADPRRAGLLYAPVAINSGFQAAIFKTTDGARSWIGPILTTDIFEGVLDLAVGSTEPQTLYAALGQSLRTLPSPSHSILASRDGGATWSAIFSSVWVDAIVADPIRPATLYAGTRNGVYRLTPGGPGTILGQETFSALALLASPDGSTLYALDISQQLSTLGLGSRSRTTRSLPPR